MYVFQLLLSIISMNLYRKLLLALFISGIGMLSYAVLGNASSMLATMFEEDEEPKQDAVASTDNLSEDNLYGVKPMEAITYEDLQKEYPMDLQNPSNVNSVIEYDDATGNYILRTKVGDMEVTTPFVMSPEEYQRYRSDERRVGKECSIEFRRQRAVHH